MEKERYSRNIKLNEIGEEGQQKLSKAGVLIVGLGGLGSPVLQYLAAAGIGRIGIMDRDFLEKSNLQRQVLYQEKDLGKPKAVLAANWLRNFNSQAIVDVFQDSFESSIKNIDRDQYSLLIDCTDNYESRLQINQYCIEQEISYIHGAVQQWQGHVFSWKPGTACYHCIFRDIPKNLPSPSNYGIFGAVAAVIGSLQATEAVKILLDKGELLTNSLLTYNALKMRFHKVNIQRDPDCPACSHL